jgi:EmrB/QacA subfamily drug resistance transporter
MSSRAPCDDTAVRFVVGQAPCAPSTRRWVLAATILGSTMAFVDGTIVNVSLPAIQSHLGASGTGAQWIVEAYALFLSSLILVGGALGDRTGRRGVFLGGVAIFAASSAACGLARDVTGLVAARAVQGIGAALLVPNSLAILGAAFPASERGRAIGTWSAFTSAAMAVGPLFGGWLVQAVSWRAAFFVNLPIAAAVAAIAAFRVPESRDPDVLHLDVLGASLVTLGLAGATYGLIESADRGFRDARVLGSIAVGLTGLAAFVFVELRKAHPMVPPSLFRIRAFLAANLLTLFLYAALGAALYFFAFDLIQAQGFTPAAAGAAMMPLILFMFALSRWSGGLADRVGARLPLTVGPAITGLGFGLLAIPGAGANFWTGFLPGLCAIGFGISLTVAPLTTVVLGSVDPRHSGTASGINNAVARVAGLLAIAALGILFAGAFHRSLERRLASAAVSPATIEHVRAESGKLGATSPPPGAAQDEARIVSGAVKNSVAASFRLVSLACAALALAASGCALWGIRGGSASLRAAKRAAA